MKRFKELKACIASITALQAGNDVKPEQRELVERAKRAVRRLARHAHPSRKDIFRAVLEITEALIRAFRR